MDILNEKRCKVILNLLILTFDVKQYLKFIIITLIINKFIINNAIKYI